MSSLPGNTRIKTGLAAVVLLLLAMTILFACKEVLPVAKPEYSDHEIEAMRVTKQLRAALAEIVRHDPATAPRTPQELCRQLLYLRDSYASPWLNELLDSLPAAWLADPQAAPGLHGGYRFMIVQGDKSGIYALPLSSGPTTRMAFYAPLSAGLFERLAVDSPPLSVNDSAWRPVLVLK